MTRIRIEGLLAAFPKLLGSDDKQHTFVETEAVRYVYQPLENFFLLAITNRASNIIEDLETLQLLSRVLPDVAGCPASSLTEDIVVSKAFELIFAFDEVITAGGYREPVTMQQIKVNMEMESHEETLHNMIKVSKMETARDKARDAERLLRERRQESPNAMAGRSMEGFGSSISSAASRPMDNIPLAPQPQTVSEKASVNKGRAPVKGMSLFAKEGKNKSLEDALVKEDKLAPVLQSSATVPDVMQVTPAQYQHPIMLAVVEKVSAALSRDGVIEAFDIKGSLTLTAVDDEAAKCAVHLKPITTGDFSFTTHPKVNKVLFDQNRCLQLKDPSKGFPSARAVGVLKWNFAGNPEEYFPLKVNCWPEEESRGKMNVSIEYTMEELRTNIELHEVQIVVPLGTSDAPEIVSVDGGVSHNVNGGELTWSIPIIDRSNSSGSLEFNIAQKSANIFFPISVNFTSQTLFCDVEIDNISSAETQAPIMYGSSKIMTSEDYTIE